MFYLQHELTKEIKGTFFSRKQAHWLCDRLNAPCEPIKVWRVKMDREIRNPLLAQ